MTTRPLAAPPNQRVLLRFGGTYYFVYSMDAFISRESIVTRAFSDHFHEGLEYYVTPFRRWTALHVFTEFFIDQVIAEDFERASRARYRQHVCSSQPCRANHAWLLAADLMKSHELDASRILTELERWVGVSSTSSSSASTERGPGPNFDAWEDVEPSEYARLLHRITDEVFFVLFANRTFLHKFHSHLAEWTRRCEPDLWLPDASLFRQASGGESLLKRAAIPEWAKRAVFFRDRGRCCQCERDLGGVYSPINRAQYDHIVPLALGGLNDVSNLQLFCGECNNEKRAHPQEPSQIYERWFPTEQQYLPR